MPEPVSQQSAVPLGDGQTDASEAVAHGDRRNEVHYDPDDRQLAKVRHTFSPEAIAAEQQAVGSEGPHPVDVTDVASVKPAPSVWDASPRGT